MKCKECYSVTEVNGEWVCDCELHGTETCGMEYDDDKDFVKKQNEKKQSNLSSAAHLDK